MLSVLTLPMLRPGPLRKCETTGIVLAIINVKEAFINIITTIEQGLVKVALSNLGSIDIN